MFETTTSTAPAHWASYVINGDASGIDDADISACDAWLIALANDGWQVVSTEGDEPYFARYNDAGTLACDVITYTLLSRGV
jgi:hypothetical protein